MEPLTRTEQLLDGQDLEPITRKEQFIKKIYDKTQAVPEPITREEYFLNKAGEGGGDVTIEQLNVSQNGTYSEQGKAYSPVVVSVPEPVLTTKTITENGEYNASADNADGFSKVTVAVAPPENSYVLTTKKDDVVDISDAAEFSVRNVKADVTASDEVFVYVGKGSEVINDKEPYNFRASKSGDRVYEDAIVGGSVAWNQLAETSASWWSAQKNGINVDYNNLEFAFTKTNTGACGVSRTLEKNHVYFVSGQFKNSSENNFSIDIRANELSYTSSNSKKTTITSSTTYENFAFIEKTDNTYYLLGIRQPSANPTNNIGYVKGLCVYDLTLALGSTIADYAYTLETSEAGSGIAWLKSQGFFTKDYYAYNAGGIESVKTSAKKVTGFNQFDEVTELGKLDTSTGQNSTSSECIRSKNYIPLLSNNTYYLRKRASTGTMYYFFYDENNVMVGSMQNFPNSSSGGLLDIPTNARYMRFYMSSAYGTSYQNDICINFHWDGERDGEYEAYEEHVYNLDSDLELRGVPKLDANNKLYYDGDTYESDGTVGRRYTEPINFGDKAWTYDSTNEVFVCITITSAYSGANCISTMYLNSGSIGIGSMPNMSMQLRPAGLYVKNTNYTDATLFKTAMNGVYGIFEKATPTTESADPYQKYQKVDNWGTEEFVDERDVPVPVGHESKYFDGEIYHTYLYDSNGDKVTVTGTADIITGEVTGGNHCDKFTIIPKSTDDNVIVETGEVEVKYLVPLEAM